MIHVIAQLHFSFIFSCSIQLNKYTFCLLCCFFSPQFLEKTLRFRNGHHETIQAAVVEELPPAGE